MKIRTLLMLASMLLALGVFAAGPVMAQDETEEPTEEPTEEMTEGEEAEGEDAEAEEPADEEAEAEEPAEEPTEEMTEGDDAEAPAGAPGTGLGGAATAATPFIVGAIAVGGVATAAAVRRFRGDS